MKIEEAIKNLEKEMKCRKEDCLGQECHEGSCPYFLKDDAVTESLQVVVEWYRNVFIKNIEGKKK